MVLPFTYVGTGKIMNHRKTENGEFAKALQLVFHRTHNFTQEALAMKAAGVETSLKVPKDYEEYIEMNSR